nr:MAG TPA: hypothetical protein [Caudoviricetes sp.]
MWPPDRVRRSRGQLRSGLSLYTQPQAGESLPCVRLLP